MLKDDQTARTAPHATLAPCHTTHSQAHTLRLPLQVRIVFQSESYGPMYYESYPFIVNPDGAAFTGSHVMCAHQLRTAPCQACTHAHARTRLL